MYLIPEWLYTGTYCNNTDTPLTGIQNHRLAAGIDILNGHVCRDTFIVNVALPMFPIPTYLRAASKFQNIPGMLITSELRPLLASLQHPALAYLL